MKIKAIGDRAVVEVNPPEKETVVGGIVVPGAAIPRSTIGVVRSVGEKVVGLKPGNLVLLPEFGGSIIKLDGREYLMIRESDILAVVQ